MQQVFHNFVFLFIRTLALLRTLICRKRCNKRAEGLLQAIACSNLNFPGQLIRCPRARASRTTRCPAAIVHFRDRAVPVSSKKIMPALAESHRAPDPEFKRPCRTVIARHRNTVANISASPYFLRFPLPTLSPPFFLFFLFHFASSRISFLRLRACIPLSTVKQSGEYVILILQREKKGNRVNFKIKFISTSYRVVTLISYR